MQLLASRFLIAAALLGLLAVPAGATVVRGFSLHQLTGESHAVVHGTVIDQEAVYDARWQQVYTLSHVRVAASWVGADRAGDVVVVKQLGGVLDGRHYRVAGTADLALGDEVVVFARTDGAFHYLVGMGQGGWSVTRAAHTPPMVTRGGAGLGLVAGVPGRRLAPAQLTLDALRAAVGAARSTP